MLDAFPDFDGLDLDSVQADVDFDGMQDPVDGSLDVDHDSMNDFYDGHLDVDGNGLTDHADPMVADYVQSMSMPDPFGGPEPTNDYLTADADFDSMPDSFDGGFDFDHDTINDSYDGHIDVDGNGFVDHADPMVAGYVDSVPSAGSSAMAAPDASAAGAADVSGAMTSASGAAGVQGAAF